LALAGAAQGDEQFDEAQELRVSRLPLTLKNWGILNPASVRDYVGLSGQIARTVRAHGVESLHCGRCLPEGLLGALVQWRTGVPFGCYAHGEELTYGRESRELGWLMRLVFARARWVIANSQNTRRLLAEEWKVPTAKLRLMHPGVDTQRYRPARRSSEDRARLGWGERRVVLTVGRLQERKGQDVVIRALRDIHRQIPDVLYAVVGSGERRDFLHELAIREGVSDHVVFHGELNDAETLACFQQCDVFVLPNRQVGRDIEGFGMVLVEAQACGKPVVAGASGGTAETMRIPETGLIVDCEEPGKVAETLVDLLSDEPRRLRMGRASREWAVQRFDWSELARQAGEIFASMG
jgi:phosphatidylinositol alpha-1,6-mannosyltransferase